MIRRNFEWLFAHNNESDDFINFIMSIPGRWSEIFSNLIQNLRNQSVIGLQEKFQNIGFNRNNSLIQLKSLFYELEVGYFNNTISGNDNYNIYLETFDDHPTYPGKFSLNRIIGNRACDQRTSIYDPNAWDMNYYSYYMGADTDDDGFGDTPQTLFNSFSTIEDANPIWWDSPIININSPSTDEAFGATPPSVSYTVTRGIEYASWYMLNDGATQTQNYTYSGSIDQNAWNQMEQGNVWITFYINDSRGWENSDTVQVIKNLSPPNISIYGVNEGDLFGPKAPESINIVVNDPHGVDEVWYMLYNGTDNTNNNTWTGSIDQSVWNQIGNGTVTIIFFANDTAGNIVTNQTTVRKDVVIPNIQITAPSPMDLFGKTPPLVTVTSDDVNGISEQWYMLYNSTDKTINFTWMGSIAQSIWDQIGNGTVTLRIYANDTAGNIAFDNISVRKDILVPSIAINTPTNLTYWETRPSLMITVSDPNFDDLWYRIGLYVKPLTNNTAELLNEVIWNNLPEGMFQVEIFANDTLGNLNSIYIINLIKDVLAPQLNIISPSEGEEFEEEPPLFTISIFDATLNTTWYNIAGVGVNFIFIGGSGNNIIEINQPIWENLEEGEIAITFYANDSFGRINQTSITIKKDLSSDIEDDDDEDDQPDIEGPTIPFGNNYLIFTIISIMFLIMKKRHRIIVKQNMT